jgi:hypothetical protein
MVEQQDGATGGLGHPAQHADKGPHLYPVDVVPAERRGDAVDDNQGRARGDHGGLERQHDRCRPDGAIPPQRPQQRILWKAKGQVCKLVGIYTTRAANRLEFQPQGVAAFLAAEKDHRPGLDRGAEPIPQIRRSRNGELRRDRGFALPAVP